MASRPSAHKPLRLDTPKGQRFLRDLAQFSGLTWGEAAAAGAGSAQAYHAAQDTRLRDFAGGTLGYRSRPEEDMLRPFDRSKVVARGRLMFRNNPYLAALLLAYVQEIGTPTYKSGANLGDPAKSKEYNDAREQLLHRYFLDCESEHALSLEQVIEIYNFEDCIAGEMFIVKLRDGTQQLIPSELCGSENVTLAPMPAVGAFQDGTPFPVGATERDGLVRDADRNIIGYRFGRRDPNLGTVSFSAKTSVVVPAAYVWHLYDPDRCEQNRGVPKLAPILNFLLDLYETADARVQQVKNQACLSMWITKNIDPLGFAEAMRGAIRGGDISSAATLKEIAGSRSQYQEMRKGAVYYGAVGETVNLIEPKVNAQNFHDHYIDLLQVCAACLGGMPVEVGLEGFRSSSYSSARATMNKWRRNVLRKRNRIAQKYLDPLQLWQTNRAEFFEDLARIPADQKAECYWGWPAIPDIDGLKTSLQNTTDLANNATNLRTIYAEKGQHYDVEIRQIVAEKMELLNLLIEGAKALGYTADQARSIALTQMPSADGRALAALIQATGAFTEDTAAQPNKKPAA